MLGSYGYCWKEISGFFGGISIEEELANLNIDEDDETLVQAVEEDVGIEKNYNLCMLGGISITNIRQKRVLFRFYNRIDLKRVIDGMAQQFGNFIGQFLEYDATLVIWGVEEREGDGSDKEREGRKFEGNQTTKPNGVDGGRVGE
ncbi:hypothetical protein Goklo_024373, partial [Gossypium klotzschianum]|nr:hypothetical protein [Gossypium klotzschianum]